MHGYVLDSYFFRLTQVACISISVCCTSDFENENGAKIETGIGSLGEQEQKWFGENIPIPCKTRSTD